MMVVESRWQNTLALKHNYPHVIGKLKTLIDTIDGFEKNRAINEQLLGVKGSRPVGSPQLLGRPFVAAGKTYHGHQDQARLPVRRLLLPSCQVHQVRTRPGYQAVVFFYLLARLTRSRTPVFLLLPGPGHQSSCFFLLRRPSPTDSGVNGCPRLYTPISQWHAWLIPIVSLVGWPGEAARPPRRPLSLAGQPIRARSPSPGPTGRVEDRIGSYSAKSQPSVPKICVCCTN